MDINYTDFELLLEEKFGRLTPQAKHCAEDFFANYDQFIDKFKHNDIQIIASPFVLAQKIPSRENTKYQTFNGFSILLFIVGIILFFFNWKIALLTILTSVLSKFFSKHLKNKSASKFTSEIFKKFDLEEFESFFDITQYYIAGIIQLRTSIGAAHLPLLPSTSLTGIKKHTRQRD